MTNYVKIPRRQIVKDRDGNPWPWMAAGNLPDPLSPTPATRINWGPDGPGGYITWTDLDSGERRKGQVISRVAVGPGYYVLPAEPHYRGEFVIAFEYDGRWSSYKSVLSSGA